MSAMGMLQTELEKCMEELNTLQAKSDRHCSMQEDKDDAWEEIIRIAGVREEAPRLRNPGTPRRRSSSRRRSKSRERRQEFAGHSKRFHDMARQKWDVKSEQELLDLILDKLGSVSLQRKIDPDLQPLMQEFIDRLLEDSALIAKNLQNTANSPETAEMLGLSDGIVWKHLKVRGMRKLIQEEMLAFVDIFEASSISGQPRRSSKERYLLFIDYYPMLMREGYSGHTCSTIRNLRGMGVEIARKLLIIGTHVMELVAGLFEYAKLARGA